MIKLVDNTSFTVGANSEAVIDDFVYDTNVTLSEYLSRYAKGVCRLVGSQAKRLTRPPRVLGSSEGPRG